MTFLPNADLRGYDIASGGFGSDISKFFVFGRAEDVDTSDGEIIVEPQKVAANLPSGTGDLRVISTSTADAAGGSGVSQIKLLYLDGDWELQTVNADVTGTTANDLGVTARRVIFARANLAGTGASYNDAVPIGNIDIIFDPTGSADVLCRLMAGTGVCEGAIYTVPAGMTGAFTLPSHVVEGSSKSASFWLNVRRNDDPPASPYMPIIRIPVASEFSGQRMLEESYWTNLVYPERTDVWVSCEVDQNNTSVEAMFGITLQAVP